MLKNAHAQSYIRTANRLDALGLHTQADNVEALMRVATSMANGNSLFSDRGEHEEYLEFLKEAKTTLASNLPVSNVRTASDRNFVMREIDRYIELWSFMLREDNKTRTAQNKLSFSERFAAKNPADLTPSQLSLLDELQPIFQHAWLNGIRELFGEDNTYEINARQLNNDGSSIKNTHKDYRFGKDDISARDYNKDTRQKLARAKYIASLDSERSPQDVLKTQAGGLAELQSPEAKSILELMVSKKLEPVIQKTNSPEKRQMVASDAAALINWFLKPVPNNKSGIQNVEKMARMVNMPTNQTLPPDFFEQPAHAEGTDGVRWFDESEIEHLKSRSNPDSAILNIGASDNANEEEVIDSIEEPTAEPITEPIAEQIEEPIQSTSVEEQIETQPIDETPVEPDEKSTNSDASGIDIQYILDTFDYYANRANYTSDTADSDYQESDEKLFQIGASFDSPNESRQKIAELIAPEAEAVPGIVEQLNLFSDSEIQNLTLAAVEARYKNSTPEGSDAENKSEPEIQHAQGTEEKQPEMLIPDDIQTEISTHESPNPVDNSINEPSENYQPGSALQQARAEYKENRKQKRIKMVKWLAGLGLSSAAILSIIQQMAPSGAASEAVNPSYEPSAYSQPAPQYQPQYPEPAPENQPSPQVNDDSESKISEEYYNHYGRGRWNPND
jgi:hypothetical protein